MEIPKISWKTLTAQRRCGILPVVSVQCTKKMYGVDKHQGNNATLFCVA
jgi:hypothetical protein